MLTMISNNFNTFTSVPHQAHINPYYSCYEFEGGLRRIINFNFESYKLVNPKKISEGQIDAFINELIRNVYPSGLVNALMLIRDVHQKYLLATHQLSTVDGEKRKEAIANFTRLNDIISKLINTQIGINNEFYTTLFDLAIDQCNLSDGQSALLQIAVFLYTQETNLDEAVIFFDEPEIHLHPSALNLVIDRLDKCITNGQIWIATHSVPLLAHIASIEPSAIWYMEKGKIEYGGRIPEKVLESLIGDEGGIAELQDFCSLPAQYATNQYALECLLEAQTVGAKVGDKQTGQVVDSLRQAVEEKGRTIRVLDFGAGKGRLADALYYWAQSEAIENLSELIDYIAFDEFEDDKSICQTAISRIYGNADGRYFNDLEQLLLKVDCSTVDYIVTCNVLHEIPVIDWQKYINSTGLFYKLLAEEGKMIWIEDRLMPKGEKAHRNGFIVFGPLQIKILFNIQGDKLDCSYADEQQRLMKCIIDKSQIAGFNTDNLKEALKSLRDFSQSKVKAIREEPLHFKKGKEHGFWSQQHINAILSLGDLGE